MSIKKMINRKIFTPFILLNKADSGGMDGNNVKAMVTTFNDPDKSRDVFLPTAFDEFLADFEDAGYPLQMQIAHDNATVAGEWTKFTKTDDGIIGEGMIFDDLEDGKRAKKLLERNIVRNVSIGMRSTEYLYNDGGGITFVKASLREVSLVTHPANLNAEVLEVKDEGQPISFMGKFARALDARITKTYNQRIAEHIDKAINNQTETNNV